MRHTVVIRTLLYALKGDLIMATAKKKTTKKAAPRPKKAAARPKKVAKIESFKLSRETSPFVSFKITEQTVYWSILLILILILTLWILQIQINVSEILDSIKTV